MSETHEIVKTHNAIWIGTALLHRTNPTKGAFTVKEIFSKVKELNLLSVADETIYMHISSHCVANGVASPDNHRKLYRLERGLYRLYRLGDPYHPSRENGRTAPVPESIPEKFRELVDWYHKDYCDKTNGEFQEAKNQEVDTPHARIKNGSITLPPAVIEQLNLTNGDYLVFLENTDNTMTIKKGRISISF